MRGLLFAFVLLALLTDDVRIAALVIVLVVAVVLVAARARATSC